MKKLYLARADKKIFGVCGGIGESYDIDPTLIRLIWVVGTIFTGFVPGIIAYILFWLIMPLNPERGDMPGPQI